MVTVKLKDAFFVTWQNFKHKTHLIFLNLKVELSLGFNVPHMTMVIQKQTLSLHVKSLRLLFWYKIISDSVP